MKDELTMFWVNKAKNDLLNADNNLNSDNIPHDTVCFHCQQAVEKLLKAFLVYKEQNIPRTHDLLSILELIKPLEDSVEVLRDYLVILNPYAIEIRYPDTLSMPVLEDSKEARDASERVLTWLKKILPDLF